MRSSHQRGSAIIMLFIAVALFGMISYVFLQGSRGNTGMITKEASKAAAMKSQDCANSMQMANKRLQARGCGALVSQEADGSNPNIGAPTDGSCSIFHPNGGGVSNACATSPVAPVADPCLAGALGTFCTSDGAFYIGDIGGDRIYARATDIVPVMNNWKTANTSTAGTGSATNGVANTDAMIAAGAAAHPAANACRLLGAQWYLPAINELALIWDNRTDIVMAGKGFNPALGYWSSTQASASTGRALSLGTGIIQTPNKNLGRYVRCVRR